VFRGTVQEVDRGGIRRWDRFWLGVYDVSNKLTVTVLGKQRFETIRGRSPLAKRLKVRPVLGGMVAGVIWGACMFIFFAVMEGFRQLVALAVIWGIGGALFGFAIGSLWSVLRRHGIDA
jgi:hypothetical protein